MSHARLTPDVLEQLVHDNPGIPVISGRFYSKRGDKICYCPLSLWAKSLAGRFPENGEDVINILKVNGIDETYIDDFWHTFDGRRFGIALDNPSPGESDGYACKNWWIANRVG